MDPRMPTVVAYRSGYLMHSKDDRGKYNKNTLTEMSRRKQAGETSRAKEAQEFENNRVDIANQQRYAAMEKQAQNERISKRRSGQFLDEKASRNSGYTDPSIVKDYPGIVRKKQEYAAKAAQYKKQQGQRESAIKDRKQEVADRTPANNFKDEVARQGRNLERYVRKNFNNTNSNVPSQNPTAGGGAMPNYVKGDKDRANHKYIAKVETKNGKTRYIYSQQELERLQRKGYDITTASGQHLSNKDAFDSQANAKRAEASARAKAKDRALQRGKEQEAAYQRQKKREADPMYHVQRFAKATMRNIQKTAGNVMNSAKNFLKQFGIG